MSVGKNMVLDEELSEAFYKNIRSAPIEIPAWVMERVHHRRQFILRNCIYCRGPVTGGKLANTCEPCNTYYDKMLKTFYQ